MTPAERFDVLEEIARNMYPGAPPPPRRPKLVCVDGRLIDEVLVIVSVADPNWEKKGDEAVWIGRVSDDTLVA
jgi:hypothetical protein